MNRAVQAVGAFAIALMISSSAFAQKKVDVAIPAELQSAKKIVVGINCNYPPAGYVELNGKPAGYEISFVKRISEFAFGDGAGLETQCVNDSNRIPFLQSGKVDFVLASLAYTPARAEQIDYSDPIWVSNLQLLTRKDSPINSYDDLAGRTVVTVTGSTYQTWLQKCHPKGNLVTSQSPADGATMLTQGRADAFAYIDVYGFNFTRNNKDYKVVGTLAASAVQGIGIKKGNKPMADWLNAVIGKLRGEDAFYKSFADEVKDDAFVAKYRQVVPGPSLKLDYSSTAALDCKS